MRTSIPVSVDGVDFLFRPPLIFHGGLVDDEVGR